MLFASWTFTGKWPWAGHPYNSYILQAQSWLEGRLDLGRDYPHLELAIFNDKYFVSFPPFPSYVMLPFVLCGWDTCDGFIAAVSAIAGAVYAYKILREYQVDENKAFTAALLLTIGSNWLFTAQTAWVWFIAQNMAFTLVLAAIYYALKNKAGLSLAMWACAVGCRPLQFLYLPILLYLLYHAHTDASGQDSFAGIIKKRWKSVIPMAVIALSYMILNFARFGNPIEFGHNYLPEFTRVQTGQFSSAYIAQNIKSLFRLPKLSFKNAWEYQTIDGTCMFIVSPVFILFVIYCVVNFISKDKARRNITILAVSMLVIELAAITAHKTMGGSHFGNRYTNDVLPMALVAIAPALAQDERYYKINQVLLFFGMAVNVVGAVLYYAK